jgi:hypothetical protein
VDDKNGERLCGGVEGSAVAKSCDEGDARSRLKERGSKRKKEKEKEKKGHLWRVGVALKQVTDGIANK